MRLTAHESSTVRTNLRLMVIIAGYRMEMSLGWMTTLIDFHKQLRAQPLNGQGYCNQLRVVQAMDDREPGMTGLEPRYN